MSRKMQGDNIEARTNEAMIENDGMNIILHTPNGSGSTVCGAEVHNSTPANLEADTSDDAWCNACINGAE